MRMHFGSLQTSRVAQVPSRSRLLCYLTCLIPMGGDGTRFKYSTQRNAHVAASYLSRVHAGRSQATELHKRLQACNASAQQEVRAERPRLTAHNIFVVFRCGHRSAEASGRCRLCIMYAHQFPNIWSLQGRLCRERCVAMTAAKWPAVTAEARGLAAKEIGHGWMMAMVPDANAAELLTAEQCRPRIAVRTVWKA